jgi:hypothetical protein
MQKTLRTIKLGKAQELVAQVRFNDVNESADLDHPADWLGGWYEAGSGCLYVTNWQGALNTLDSAVDITNDWGNEPEERSERAATKRLLAKVLSLAPAAEVEEYQRKQQRFSQPTVPTQDSQEAVEQPPTYRCPECDTYSGEFWGYSDAPELVHSVCGREGTVASFTPGTAEYDAVYNHQEHDSDRYYREQVEGDDDDNEVAATALNLAGLSPQTWVDLAPHLSCSEAEVVKAFLTAWRDENTAEVFIQAHALADDDENDLHYQEASNRD